MAKKPTDLSKEVRMRKAGQRAGQAQSQGHKDSQRGASVTDPRKAHADAERVQNALRRSTQKEINNN